jgi:hypothetical protein
VIDAIWRHGPVAPLRLATVYLDDDNVRAALDANEEAFTAALDRVRGRSEWGVKAYAAAPSEAAEAEPDGRGGAPATGPGRAYLLRKRAERDRAVRARQDVQDAAEELHRSLGAASVAGHRYPPQDPRLSGQRDDMVLNAAYLVEDDAATAFRDAVAGWRSPHLRVELTGPWAPYSFASLEEP